eukprot:TRINITY_DN65106_c0_g1_i1.p4 TRINITY_DN65106_c0_g1~~TRINITY_DN65106_c0_g1_i1.p4  ORF type:complete len:104 (+),score=27.93 TRINITY_DN65106_c0_g1_i1:190-501(+)
MPSLFSMLGMGGNDELVAQFGPGTGGGGAKKKGPTAPVFSRLGHSLVGGGPLDCVESYGKCPQAGCTPPGQRWGKCRPVSCKKNGMGFKDCRVKSKTCVICTG